MPEAELLVERHLVAAARERVGRGDPVDPGSDDRYMHD